MAKQRADVLVVEQGLAETRSRAQALIIAGSIVALDVATGGERRIDKAGEMLAEGVMLRMKGEALRYVSRGGLKLEAALDKYGVNPAGRICMDVGASTGGFTDCLLQRSATKVYAIDVGTNQLAWKLRDDPRVVVIEKTNIRTIDASMVPEPVSLTVIDVSFISLALVIPHVVRLSAPSSELVALVKPQFEVGRADVGKGGIVRDPAARDRALAEVRGMITENGYTDISTMDSPILGAKGNHEFLLHAARH